MKQVLLFYFTSCPYCQSAIKWLEELKAQTPELSAVQVDRIDERLHPEIACQYNYWYVPTFFVDGQKLHEGVATKEIIEKVLREALT